MNKLFGLFGRQKGLSRREKAVLNILIHEVQEILKEPGESTPKLEKIEQLLNSWIRANDLHPEQVETLTTEEAERQFCIKLEEK